MLDIMLLYLRFQFVAVDVSSIIFLMNFISYRWKKKKRGWWTWVLVPPRGGPYHLFCKDNDFWGPHSTVHTVFIMAFVYEERAPMKKHTKSKLHGCHMIFEASFNFWDPRKDVEWSDQGKERLSVEQIPRSSELL